jgi:hypothetical protein
MTATFKSKIRDSIWHLSPYRSERLDELLSLMNDNKQVSGILLGGSFSYKDDFAKSDVDLFCLINDAKKFESNLNANLSRLSDVDEIIFQGNFPWTEKLYSIYFKQDIDFSIDLCLINFESSETFFWEPDGFILFDKAQVIDRCRSKQMSSPDFTKQPFLKSNPFSLSVITLKKIEKNLSRNHLWNALEQLNSLRRFVMQIIRLKEIKHDNFLGRVDRDIEDVIPIEINHTLSKTVAIYDSKDIAEKTILLIDLFVSQQKHLQNGNEKQFYDWIFKQLKHEADKLQNYF